MPKTRKTKKTIPATTNAPAKWGCSNGHTFTASYEQVKAGFLCPTCEAKGDAVSEKRTWLGMARAMEALGHSLYEIAKSAGVPEAEAQKFQADWDAMKARGEG